MCSCIKFATRTVVSHFLSTFPFAERVIEALLEDQILHRLNSMDRSAQIQPSSYFHDNEISDVQEEREEYCRAFCTRNIDPKCVIDFPFEDAGGLNLSRNPDNRLLQRLYCFEDHQDDMHVAVGAKRRRVILKVHTLLKWRDRGDKLFLRASKVTAAKFIHANWNAQTASYEQETGRDGLRLVPVKYIMVSIF